MLSFRGKFLNMNKERALTKKISGQAMFEYIIVFVSFFAVITVLAILLYALRQNGVRVLDLVSSEYP